MIELLKMDPRPWIYCVASGAGAGIQQALWETAGASGYLAGCAFPYAQYETDRFLGYMPTSYCSADESVELAMEAYCRACESLPRGQRPVGLAVTASVASTHDHRGEHRIHAAAITPERAIRYTYMVEKGGPRRRGPDGHAADNIGLFMLRAILDLDDRAVARTVEEVSEQTLRRMFFQYPYHGPNGRRLAALPTDDFGVALLPGSFNPIHQGHRAMAQLAHIESTINKPVVYVLTADSPHKPRLTTRELLSRVAMFRRERSEHPETAVLFTQDDPLFIDKARQHPGSTFVIGADTAIRMLDPQWGPEIDPMLQEFWRLGTVFYVFGREIDGVYVSAQDVITKHVPEQHRPLFHGMPHQMAPISSTELRKQA